MKVEINERERELLIGILKGQLGSVREEIYHTESAGFKKGLKDEKLTIQTLVNKFEKLTIEDTRRAV